MRKRLILPSMFVLFFLFSIVSFFVDLIVTSGKGDTNLVAFLFLGVCSIIAFFVFGKDYVNAYIGEKKECPSCKKIIPYRTRFCSGCGFDHTFLKCPHCKKTINLGETFCPSCGETLEEHFPLAFPSNSIHQETSTKVSGSFTTVQTASIRSTSINVCPVCRESVGVTDRFCGPCGAALDKTTIK